MADVVHEQATNAYKASDLSLIGQINANSIFIFPIRTPNLGAVNIVSSNKIYFGVHAYNLNSNSLSTITNYSGDVQGLAANGSDIWFAKTSESLNTIHILDTTIDTVSGTTISATSCKAITTDGTFTFVVDSGTVKKFTGTTLTASSSALTGFLSAYETFIVTDGTNLYVANNDRTTAGAHKLNVWKLDIATLGTTTSYDLNTTIASGNAAIHGFYWISSKLYAVLTSDPLSSSATTTSYELNTTTLIPTLKDTSSVHPVRLSNVHSSTDAFLISANSTTNHHLIKLNGTNGTFTSQAVNFVAPKTFLGDTWSLGHAFAGGQASVSSDAYLTLEFFVADLTISTGSLPSSCPNVPYSQTLVATGGTEPYSWAVTSGSLPTGLSLNSSTGIISGTATTTATYPFDITVTDDNDITFTQSYSIQIFSVATITNGGNYEFVYSQLKTVLLTADVPPAGLTWTLDSGILPPGLNLISIGSNQQITGIPTYPGLYNFRLRLTTSGGCPSLKLFSIFVWGPPVIITPSVPNAVCKIFYSKYIDVINGKTPYTWTILSGALPPGLSLDATTGLISGFTKKNGTFFFTVLVTDANGLTDQKNYVIKVTCPKPDPNNYLLKRLPSVKSDPVVVTDPFHQQHLIEYVPTTLKRDK